MKKIAVIGYGVVGSGVVELFYKNKKSIEKRAGLESEIKYILDIRDFSDSPYKDKFVKNIDAIINDSEISVVAECMGGIHPAYDFVKACLESGKSVATSNKELVAAKGAELLKIAAENKCNFFFEASVGGGIPIIRPLHKCLAANDIHEIVGILNGTTNFILTKMITEQMSFETALKMAQELGYAEKDPTADVEGHDACRKICILASLAFGKHVYPESVCTRGISEVSLEDVEYANAWGGSIKLIGDVKKLENGKILAFVSPMFVPFTNLLSRVDDVFNGILVMGDGIDKSLFYGRGAGKLPTASAVIADLVEALKHQVNVFSQNWEQADDNDFVEHSSENITEMFFRLSNCEKSLIEKHFGEVNFIQKDNATNGELAFTTSKMSVANAGKIAEEITKLGVEVLSQIPILNV